MFFGCHVVVICKVITMAHYRQKQVLVGTNESSEVFIDVQVHVLKGGAIGQELRSGPSKESKRGGRAAARAAAAPALRPRICMSRRDRVDQVSLRRTEKRE